MLFIIIYFIVIYNIRIITYNVSSNDAFPKAFVAFDRKLVHYEGRFHASLSGLCWVVLLHCLSEKNLHLHHQLSLITILQDLFNFSEEEHFRPLAPNWSNDGSVFFLSRLCSR